MLFNDFWCRKKFSKTVQYKAKKCHLTLWLTPSLPFVLFGDNVVTPPQTLVQVYNHANLRLYKLAALLVQKIAN